MSDKYIPRLKALYNGEIVKNLEKELNIDNVNKRKFSSHVVLVKNVKISILQKP